MLDDNYVLFSYIFTSFTNNTIKAPLYWLFNLPVALQYKTDYIIFKMICFLDFQQDEA